MIERSQWQRPLCEAQSLLLHSRWSVYTTRCTTPLRRGRRVSLGGDMLTTRTRTTASIQDEVPNEEAEERTRLGPSRGIWIAAATFVATFLAVFFGLAYLIDPPTVPRVPGSLEDGAPSGPSASSPERNAIPQQPQMPMREILGTAALPAAGNVESKATQSKRSTAAVTKNARWTRSAVFSDRRSAERDAASAKHRGYPAKVSRDGPPDKPWVVWIGQQVSRPRSEGRKSP